MPVSRIPTTVEECLDASMLFERRTLRAVREFKRKKPWRGSTADRRMKIEELHAALCIATGRQTRLKWDTACMNDGPSDSSGYDSLIDEIVMRGRPSVVTYLHLFARALGNSKIGAFRWSLNLFKRMFPVSWSRLEFDGLMVRKRVGCASFGLGQVVATPAALEAMAAAGQEAAFFLSRHTSGDWGEVDAHDRTANYEALRVGARLLSVYRTLGNVRLYVITEADRSATTIMLPEEY